MCEHNDTVVVRVKIPADLAAEGVEKWKDVQIDRCIAPLVAALQAAGIDMRGSCCGHGKGNGHIDLQDGRGLSILSVETNGNLLAGNRAIGENIFALPCTACGDEHAGPCELPGGLPAPLLPPRPTPPGEAR